MSDAPEELPADIEADGTDSQPPPSGEDLLGGQSAFAHPQWALPMVLVIAVPFLLWGVLGHPVWLLLGSPFILVLAVWIYVRVVQARRGRATAMDEDAHTGA